MNALLATLALALGLTVALFVPTDGPSAVLVCAALALPVASVIHRVKEDRLFLLRIFAAGLLFRVLLGTLIYVLELQIFFGVDYSAYDNWGYMLLKTWQGEVQFQGELERTYVGGGWGMTYMVAAVYGVIGRNTLAIQYINAVFGAATGPVVFLCAQHIFRNERVSRLAAIFAAFYPSLVLWSSQGLKDGPIIFLLALTMFATLRLGERVTFKYLAALLCGLLGVFSLRFYIFYMLLTAIAGALIIGMRPVAKRNVPRDFLIVIAIGLSLTYLGVLRTAGAQFERFGTLESVQNSRLDQAQSAASGFGQDADVSTVSGALSVIPLGATYLLLAPFPWQMANLRQSITLPEMLVWWASVPVLILGLWFTIKYRLRQALPILLFTTMLTLAYSVTQGNVGTAYRQRAQLLIFYFIFAAVGYVLLKERNEGRHREAQSAKRKAIDGRVALPKDAATTGYWESVADSLSRKAGF